MPIVLSKTKYGNYWYRKLATRVKDKEMGRREVSPNQFNIIYLNRDEMLSS